MQETAIFEEKTEKPCRKPQYRKKKLSNHESNRSLGRKIWVTMQETAV